MRVELTRFRIRPGKSERVDEWLRMLNERMPETIATLERERMKVEVIFRELVAGEQYLSWFSIQGEGGESVHTSPHDVDRLHLEFWRECIDPSAGAIDAVPQVVMVPEQIARALEWPSPAGSAVAWRGESSLKAMPAVAPNPEDGAGSNEPRE
jgi:hypothetical protein